MYMKKFDDYNTLSKEKNNNVELKDIKLDIEEAQYFVQKYIIITVYYLCDFIKREECKECKKYEVCDKDKKYRDCKEYNRCEKCRENKICDKDKKYRNCQKYKKCIECKKYKECREYKEYKDIVSANQIRKFLAAVNQINNKLVNKDNEVSTSGSKEKIPDSIINDIKYMKAQLAYLVGRNKDVNIRDGFKERNRCKNVELNDMLKLNMLKPYNDTAKIEEILNSIGNKIGIEALYIRILPKIDYIIEHKRLEDFKELARYIEAIVAYHRFYGGK